MRYVGATNGYITLPFVFEGIFMGLIAGVLAFGIQWLVYDKAADLISENYRMFSTVGFGSFALILAVCFLLIGLFAGVVGSLIALAKHLREKD